ncbi:MAG: rRNA maturation RNase YbeY [Deltaproteobacteria bacterium]|nr:rRNA maturation RNase YbeY [Deltaproteobacteria bacterium]
MAILIESRQKKIDIDIPRVRQAVNNILKYLHIEDSEISLLFLDDEGITGINYTYLQRNYPTNVIAFSMREGEHGNINPHILGDIVISVETTQRYSEQEGIPFSDELDYFIIHGLLHLLGYDHEESETGSERMKQKEREIFFHLNNYIIG